MHENGRLMRLGMTLNTVKNKDIAGRRQAFEWLNIIGKGGSVNYAGQCGRSASPHSKGEEAEAAAAAAPPVRRSSIGGRSKSCARPGSALVA